MFPFDDVIMDYIHHALCNKMVIFLDDPTTQYDPQRNDSQYDSSTIGNHGCQRYRLKQKKTNNIYSELSENLTRGTINIAVNKTDI